MGERPFNAMGGFMRLTETMDAILIGPHRVVRMEC